MLSRHILVCLIKNLTALVQMHVIYTEIHPSRHPPNNIILNCFLLLICLGLHIRNDHQRSYCSQRSVRQKEVRQHRHGQIRSHVLQFPVYDPSRTTRYMDIG